MEARAAAGSVLSRRSSPANVTAPTWDRVDPDQPHPVAKEHHRLLGEKDKQRPVFQEYCTGDSKTGVPPHHKARSHNRLCLSTEVPAWNAANQHILTGYRPVNPSLRLCLESLASLHNESVNIYSHLIPCALALVGNYALHLYFNARFPAALPADRLVFHLFLTGSVLCFGVSASYHVLLCHSRQCHDLWLRLDYVAIVIQILVSFISGIYVGFYCEPGPRGLYWGMIGVLSFMTCFVMLHPRLQSQDYRLLRLWVFVATGLSGFAPIFHAMAIFPYEQIEKHMGVRYYYLEGIIILAGAFAYGIHFPEKWFPIKYDIFGASHQIFHVCVVLGAVSHFYGILSAYEYTYDNPRC